MQYFLIVILIALSAFFSGSEISYASLNGMRMKNAAENGGPAAKAAYSIYQAYDSALVTILIGNNFVNIASSSVATASKSTPAYSLMASFMVRRRKGLPKSIAMPL